MKDWSYSSVKDIPYTENTPFEFFYSGRYIMEIEVGNGNGYAANPINDKIDIEYSIGESYPSSGIKITNNIVNTTATESGTLWLRVVNLDPGNITGNITATCSGYVGTTLISKFIQDVIIVPLENTFYSLSILIFVQLTHTPILQQVIQILLILYVVLYALYFTLGLIQVSTIDLLARITKIIIINYLFFF